MSVTTTLLPRALLAHWTAPLAALATGTALVALGLWLWGIRALGDVMDAVGESVTISAHLEADLDETGVEAVLKTVAARPDVRFVRFLGADDQAARLRALLGETWASETDARVQALGAMIEVGVAFEGLDREGLGQLTRALEGVAGIEGVEAAPEAPEAMEAFVDLRDTLSEASLTWALLALLLGLGASAAWASGAVTRNELLVRLAARLGATPTQLAAPIVIAALVIGLLGAGLGGWLFARVTGGLEGVLVRLPGGSAVSAGPFIGLFFVAGPVIVWAGAQAGLRRLRQLGSLEGEARVGERPASASARDGDGGAEGP
jgi:cell division protein FtsX